MFRSFHIRYVFSVVFILIVCGLYYVGFPTPTNNEFISLNEQSENEVLDIMDDSDPPAGSIFFIETTHMMEREVIDIQISHRKACAVESTAKTNPNMFIYVLFTTSLKHPQPNLLNTEEYAALKEIYSLKNVKIRSMDVNRFIKDSPIESLFSSGKFGESYYPNVHLSDILRLLVLWRYGGTYLDLDMIVTKSFDKLGKNYCVLESDVEEKLNNAQINLDNTGVGRKITEACLKELATSFEGNGWSNNGPDLLTIVVNKVCDTTGVASINNSENNCKGVRILPHWIFNPYDWRDLTSPFNASFTEEGYEIMKKSYAIHVYGHVTDEYIIYKNQSYVLYAELAKRYCPASYYNSGDYF